MSALLRCFAPRGLSMREQWHTRASASHAPEKRYISGPHSRDYYLLLDEQGARIFDVRLAAHVREARGACDGHADLATASLLEMWIDDAEKHVWYVFGVTRGGEATENSQIARRWAY